MKSIAAILATVALAGPALAGGPTGRDHRTGRRSAGTNCRGLY